MIGIFILQFVRLCVIMMIFLSSFLLVFYFCLFFLITKVVSPPSTLVVHPSGLSLDGILFPLELLL